jgi:hypothetical protein
MSPESEVFLHYIKAERELCEKVPDDINGAPYYANPAAANSSAAFGSDAEIPEEIKRRQRALLVSYVIALRAR